MSSFNNDTKIQVSTPKNISKEIRCWVVNKKIITASQYRLGSRVFNDPNIEETAIEFAQSMVNVFQLADAFVMDIGLINNGWKIIECGCINSAGFYAADLQKLLMSLEYHFDSIEQSVKKSNILN